MGQARFSGARQTKPRALRTFPRTEVRWRVPEVFNQPGFLLHCLKTSSRFFFFFVKFIHFLEKEVHTQPASSILPSDAWARA